MPWRRATPLVRGGGSGRRYRRAVVTTPTVDTGDAAARAAADETATRIYAGYFGLQAVGGIAFWVLVATVP